MVTPALVRRLVAAVCFYERQFPTSAGTTVAGYPAVRTGQVLMLFSNVRRPASPPPLAASRGGVTDHVGLRVRDLYGWVSRLQRGGVKVLRRPYRFGNSRAVLVEVPSRQAIELVEVP